MNHGHTNRGFLSRTAPEIRREVLENIAGNYGISEAEALEEVCSDDAEQLLDYLSGTIRASVSVLMQRSQLAA